MSDRCFFRTQGNCFFDNGFYEKAVASLASAHVSGFDLNNAQLYAWREELRILEPVAKAFPDATFAFEYMIPRMGKRVDVVILQGSDVFIVEFKIGEKSFLTRALDQVQDYVFDLKNFHELSWDANIIPILVCTDAPSRAKEPLGLEDDCNEVVKTNGSDIAGLIREHLTKGNPIDPDRWINAQYSPTPTIIEAAQALYQSNEVEDISRSEAGTTNITLTTECVNSIINRSKAESRKSICFVTGVPGAGKTLVGLNIAAKRRGEESADNAIFLSGNGPLIEVLQASLVEDQQIRNAEKCRLCKALDQKTECTVCCAKKTKREIQREVKAFVQGVHLFREEYFASDSAPIEHIAIFDESQRAWSRDQLSFKMKTRWQNKREVTMSEPDVLIGYMDRHDDWAVIVCLVGGGQEIHQGEAGIIEWFDSIKKHHPGWDVYVSDKVDSEVYMPSGSLSESLENPIIVDGLHLSVDMRSFRNQNVAAFAEALISNRPRDAKALYDRIFDDYPIYVTRNLNLAKDWVRDVTKRPSDRYGIVADSYGQRIRADGITVPTSDFDAVKWFLRGKDEIDSSYYMEIAASEFKIQGLEIDYAVVAWEGDYRYHDGQFTYHRFYGGKWQNVNAEMPRRYLKNGYRVLLTRARQGFVIYVPKGSPHDATRKPEFYDETYEYLLKAGVRELE